MKIISKIISVSLKKIDHQKTAMALAEPSPEVAAQMKEKGMYVFQDMISSLPNSTQAQTMQAIEEIRNTGASEFFSNMKPRTVISLPQIYVVSPNDIFEYNGSKYVTIEVDDGSQWKTPGVPGKKYKAPSGTEYPMGSQYPGEIRALNIENGKVEVLPLPLVKDKITVPTGNIDSVLAETNEEIENYNQRVRAIAKALGADKLVLQIERAKNHIDNRLNELYRIIEGNKKKLEKVLPYLETQKSWDADLMNSVKSGKLSLKDAYDTIWFHYQSIPEQLISDINGGKITVPEELKAGLLAIAEKEIKMKQEKEDQKAKDEAERQKMMGEIPEIHETEIDPFVREDIPSAKRKYKTVDLVKSIHHEIATLKNKISGSEKNVEMLLKVKESIENMERYMGALKEGQRSKKFLNTPEGKPVLDAMEKFLVEATLFLKVYNINTKIIEDGKINSKLFGSKGTTGNALLAAAMMRMYNVVKETIAMYTGGDPGNGGGSAAMDVPSVKEPTGGEPVATVQSRSKNMVTKLSEILWKAFEDRFKNKC